MKKIILASFVIFSSLFFLNTRLAHAQMGSMMGLDNEETEVETKEGHAESVEVVLQGILESQNVSTVQELDLSKVSDDDWERLGDAVMELQHPGEAHEVMDRMMGGEGSESLRQMHINMGQAYLGYGNTNYGPGMMMGGDMMGYNNNRNFNAPTGMMGFGSMMGYGGYGILGTVTWIMAIAFLASGTYFFLRRAHKK
jgi:hypothetical protein